MGHIFLPQWQTARTPVRIGLGIKIIDNPIRTNLYEGFDRILLPVSQLPHFVAVLHSLMCSTHQNDPDNFGFRSTIELSVGRLCHLNKNQSYDTLLKPFEGLWGFTKAKIRSQGKRDLQIQTLETELRKPAICISGWALAMYSLHQELVMVKTQKPGVPQTSVRDYYLDLVEKMREPCAQVGMMRLMSPGALKALHQLRWCARMGLVRHELYLSLDDKALCTMQWLQICNELKELRRMCENDIPMYHAEARPTHAAISEWIVSLEDAVEADTDHTLYDENDKRMIWDLHSMIADINDDLLELCRDTWHLANGAEADEDDREDHQIAAARYRKKHKHDFDITVHGQTGS